MSLMSRRVLGLLAAVTICCATLANAQYRPYQASHRATGETWHVEFGVALWQPPPDIVVSSEALGIIGSEIDAQTDLGFEKKTLKGYDLVLRPAKKHKFRFGYTPISYAAETILKRTIVFNGQSYELGVPINSSIDWKAWRFGYEYDFIYRDRGFVGFILEAKYTNANVTLKNPLTTEFAAAKAPIPAIGAIVRVYPLANVSLTGEFVGFKLPKSSGALEGYDGHYYDLDIYTTLNFTDNVGVRGGYKSLSVAYRKDLDRGDLVLKGLYVMGVIHLFSCLQRRVPNGRLYLVWQCIIPRRTRYGKGNIGRGDTRDCFLRACDL